MSTDTHAPAFAIVLRGYDRVQVDDYLRRVDHQLRQALERAMAAERDAADRAAVPAQTQNPYADLGTRITAILSAAEEEGRRMRGDAERYAQDLRAQAEQEARATVEKARAEAERQEAATAGAREVEERILGDARERAADLIARAQQHADERAEETVTAAQRDADALITNARGEADRLIADARRDNAELDEGLRELRERRLRTAQEVQRLVRELQEVADGLARVGGEDGGADRDGDDDATVMLATPEHSGAARTASAP
jgi:DivIVA domain-containing protein